MRNQFLQFCIFLKFCDKNFFDYNGTRPITKNSFKLIYNENVFHDFRKVVPSLNHSKIEAIKGLTNKFSEEPLCNLIGVVLFQAKVVLFQTYSRDFVNSCNESIWWRLMIMVWSKNRTLLQLSQPNRINLPKSLTAFAK